MGYGLKVSFGAFSASRIGMAIFWWLDCKEATAYSQHATRNTKLPNSVFRLRIDFSLRFEMTTNHIRANSWHSCQLPTVHQTKSIFHGFFPPESWFLALGSSLNQVLDSFFASFFQKLTKKHSNWPPILYNQQLPAANCWLTSDSG